MQCLICKKECPDPVMQGRVVKAWFFCGLCWGALSLLFRQLQSES
jgi:hypothetical protein